MLRALRLPFRSLVVLATVACVSTACLPGGGFAVTPGTRACIGLPQAICAQNADAAEARARERGTVIVGIIVRCTTVCTEAAGEAEQTVTFGDGTREQGGFGWQSAAPAPVGQPMDPAPSLPVAPTCVGLDAATCEARVQESISDLGRDASEVASIVVRCTPGPCTPEAGDGETRITFGDGTATTIGWSYRSGP